MKERECYDEAKLVILATTTTTAASCPSASALQLPVSSFPSNQRALITNGAVTQSGSNFFCNCDPTTYDTCIFRFLTNAFATSMTNPWTTTSPELFGPIQSPTVTCNSNGTYTVASSSGGSGGYFNQIACFSTNSL